ncbi:MAG: hypothetical protein ABIP41_01750 [Croceibacterium sp.]
MAKHHFRFFTKTWLGMGAVTGLALTMSTPASAETIDLLCSFDGYNQHVYFDLDRKTVVVTGSDDKPYGPYAVSISDTFFRWNGRYYNGWDKDYTIDRVAGTIMYRGTTKGGDGATQYSNDRGQCRRATQKF